MIYYGSHHITRKIISAFMDFFTNISIQKYHLDDLGNIIPYKLVKIPIMFASTERWLQVVRSSTNLKIYDPDEKQKRPIEIERLLPRMGVNIVGMNYAPERHISKTVKITDFNDNKYSKTDKISNFAPVPYSLEIELSIISKNINEGFEIVEQIIPFFTPSISFDIKLFEDKEPESIPFILNSVSTDMTDEFTEMDDRLFLITLNFNTFVNYYLPKKIDKLTTNFTFNFNENSSQITNEMFKELNNIGYNSKDVEYELADIKFTELLDNILICLQKILLKNLDIKNTIEEIKKCNSDNLYNDIIGWIIQELNNNNSLENIINKINDYIINSTPKFVFGDSLIDKVISKLKTQVHSNNVNWGSPRVDTFEFLNNKKIL